MSGERNVEASTPSETPASSSSAMSSASSCANPSRASASSRRCSAVRARASAEPPQYQTAHEARYLAVVDDLTERGLTFECFCSRKDILQAPRAPHAPEGAYPGTCRDLSDDERARRRSEGRPPAIRLRSDTTEYTVTDLLHGTYTGVVDDFVLRRGDNVPAYNLAVVVDDAAQGVDQVVRGDDLLSSSPRQAYLAALLGYSQPVYAHVPLVLNADGKRLAKRDGAVTVSEIGAESAMAQIAASLGYRATTVDGMLAEFDPARLPREPWIFHASRRE